MSDSNLIQLKPVPFIPGLTVRETPPEEYDDLMVEFHALSRSQGIRETRLSRSVLEDRDTDYHDNLGFADSLPKDEVGPR